MFLNIFFNYLFLFLLYHLLAAKNIVTDTKENTPIVISMPSMFGFFSLAMLIYDFFHKHHNLAPK
jgi:hypothetical protein